MPQTYDEQTPNFPTPNYLTLQNFKRGVITLLDKSRLPKDALQEANNLFLVEDGQPSIRPGVDWYGTASPNAMPIDGFDYFDFAGVIHLVIVAGGNVYRSTDNGLNWTICTAATLTSGLTVNMNQYNNYLYLTDGTDNITLYDGSTVLTQYVALSTPAAPTVAETGLAGTGYNYYYKIARVNTVGFSIASAASVVTQSAISRENWDSTTNFATLTTPNGIATQTRWDVYISEDNVNFYYLSSVSATSGATSAFVDDGTAIVVPSTIAPTASTATRRRLP